MAVSRRTLRLLRDLRTAVGGIADQAVRDLTAAWVGAWRGLDPYWVSAVDDLIGRAQRAGRWLTPVEIAREARVGQALDVTGAALDDLAAQATELVVAGAGAAVAAAGAAEPLIIASQVPPDQQDAWVTQAAAVVLPSALDAIRVRAQQAIVAQTRPLSANAQTALRRELVRGIEVGANPTVAARRMVARVNGAFEGGLTRATNIARTEVLDAYRTASRYAHDVNADVLDGWIWLATVTGASATRTCPSCWAMHGTLHQLSEAGPDDHQSGRCARLPHVRPWSELGIDVPEPADVTPDARALFASLPEADQLAIMGPGRLALLKSGRIDWSDFATTRDTPGWRRSYTPCTVRDLERLAARRTR